MKNANDKLPFDKLHKCYHEPARLGILSLLVRESSGLTYNELRESLELTYGNLERHMRVLAEAGLVSIDKISDTGRPKSFAKISESGRDGFLEYLDHLESILLTAQSSKKSTRKPELEDGTDGLALANS